MISGKSVQKSAVTCLVWPSSQNNYVMGLADGKVSVCVYVCVCVCVRWFCVWLQVKSGAGKGSKTQTLYSSGSYVVSLAVRFTLHETLIAVCKKVSILFQSLW